MISIPTIFICAFISMVTASVAMGVVALNDRRESAAGYWFLCFLLGAIAPLVVSVRSIFPEHIVLLAATHSVISFSAYMLFWAGFRAFSNQAVPKWPIWLTPTVWLAIYLLWPQLRHDTYLQIALHGGITGAITLLSAYTLYGNPLNRRLPMAFPLLVFLVAHVVVIFAQVVFALTNPSPSVVTHINNALWKLFMLESFIHTVFVAISCVILIKDRSEEQHRIASETDALTGISNRRAFVKDTERLLEDANDSAALAIIDVDHFKLINDQYGHQAGDHALIKFAHLVSEKLPPSALFGRLGGEEFGIYLPQSADQAEQTLELLRQHVAARSIQFHNVEIKLTVSIGMATVEKAGNGFDLLVAAADCALYIAKESGRDKLVVFSPAQRLHKIVEKDGEKRIGLADDRVSRKISRGTPLSAAD
nr:GGDEF domain-containing protein [Rhizobium sp. L1K21]